jgi:hypothetical protein
VHSEDIIDPGYIPFPNPDTILQKEDAGKAVLVNFDTGNAVSLNIVGRFIWEAADGNRSVADIISQIKEHFSGVPEGIDDDVLKLIKVLRQSGFFGYEMKAG